MFGDHTFVHDLFIYLCLVIIHLYTTDGKRLLSYFVIVEGKLVAFGISFKVKVF